MLPRYFLPLTTPLLLSVSNMGQSQCDVDSDVQSNAMQCSSVVNAPVTAAGWYPTLTCGSLKLVLLSGHTPGNRKDRWAKPGEGLLCCVCLHTRYVCSFPPGLAPLPSSLSTLSPPTSTPSSPLALLSSSLSHLLLYSYFFPFPSLLTLPSSPTVEKNNTARPTCNHVGSPGEVVVLSLIQIVTHCGVR
ncbi:unnamed protein product [Schistocephalus solidus]|uniref:Secreted protein n=1 Tax=Schistocephalus solidus TaxID=70667 RepID=A0A183TKL3_SCHSO|nr:unnamed protein product [Schistocephalus solidus]